MRKTRFWPAAAAILGAMAVIQVTSALQESMTFDEGVHLTAGYAYLKTGRYTISRDHPPLGRLLNALPLLATRAEFPTAHPAWIKQNTFELFPDVIYANRVPADTLLFLGRSVTMLFSLALGLAVLLWTRAKFGERAALAALLVYAFEPNLIAHGRYVTTDFVAALAIFLAVIAWARYLETLRARDLLWAGVALGAALSSKFSALTLAPMLLALCAVRRIGWRRFAASSALLVLVAVAVVALVYGPETARWFEPNTPMSVIVNRSSAGGELLYWVSRVFQMPAHPFLVGLNEALEKTSGDCEAYVLGQHSLKGGWWYYFPVAFGVKSTTAFVALTLLALGAGLWALARRRGDFAWYAMAVPAVVFFAVSMRSHVNLGIRHLLPLYPFVAVLLGAMAAGLPRLAPVAAVLIALHLAESAAAYPHYLPFFNVASGGPSNGHRYLLDSNIDWGQDLKRVRKYMVANHLDKVCLAYFGTAATWYHQISEAPIPAGSDAAGRAALDCVAVASINVAYDLYLPAGTYRWLREQRPTGRIGYSMWVYDFRKKR